MKTLRASALSLFVCACAAAQTIGLMPAPKQQFFDANGYPLAGGLVYTCLAGSTCPGSPQTTYTDATGHTANANPVVLDAGGYASIWLASRPYKIAVQTAAGVALYTQDAVIAAASYQTVAFNSMVPFTLGGAAAPFLVTAGSAGAPLTTDTPQLLCQIVGSTGGTSSPGCIEGFAVAAPGTGATANVYGLVGLARSDGGCGFGTCTTNAVGGIGVTGQGALNANNTVTWGGFFAASDRGFNGSAAGLEIDTFASHAARIAGQIKGLVLANYDLSAGNSVPVTNDEGLHFYGYGKSLVFSNFTNLGSSFVDLYFAAAGTALQNANTTIMSFAPAQPGPFGVGLDFSGVAFTNGAIKAADLNSPAVTVQMRKGSGLNHVSACGSGCQTTLTPCTTSASAGATCTTSINWVSATFADTSYNATCSAVGSPTGVPILSILGKNTTNIVVQIQAATAAAATYGEIDCIAMHN